MVVSIEILGLNDKMQPALQVRGGAGRRYQSSAYELATGFKILESESDATIYIRRMPSATPPHSTVISRRQNEQHILRHQTHWQETCNLPQSLSERTAESHKKILHQLAYISYGYKTRNPGRSYLKCSTSTKINAYNISLKKILLK